MDSVSNTPTSANSDKMIEPKSTSFGKDLLKLISGTTITQIVGIIVAPILTRLYSPDAFGIFAVFLSISSVVSVIACLRYEFAIMLPDTEAEAFQLFLLSTALTGLISIATFILLFLNEGSLLTLLNTPQLGPFLWIIPLSIFANSMWRVLTYWSSRQKLFGRISRANIVSSISTTIVQLGLGISGYNTAIGLISSNTIGNSSATIALTLPAIREDFVRLWNKWRFVDIFQAIRRYYRFPLYDTWSALLNSLSWQLPAFLLAAFFSPAIAGQYALAYRMLGLPMGLIGASLSQVFFQRAAAAKADHAIGDIVESTVVQLIKYSLLPLVILAVTGRDVYVIAFGVEWAEAGIYTQILSIWAFFWFLASPISTIFNVLEIQHKFLIINIAIFLTRVAALVVGGMLGQARVALTLFAISGMFVYGFEIYVALKAANVAFSSITKIIGKTLIPAAGMALLLVYLAFLELPIGIRLGIAGTGMALYFAVTLWQELVVRQFIMKKISWVSS